MSPIRLDLGREAKTGVVTVTNDSEEKLRLEVTAREWTQDADGKDVYADSADLVYYPKMMVLGAKEQRIVRAGIRVPAAAREKAYRLFIEEIPGPPASRGTAVAVAVRFGVPVFVRPPRDEPKPEIGPVALDNGTVSVRVRNAGNAHCVVRGVTVTGRNSRGEPVFSREINGWYLLAGASRGYAAGIPADVCPDVASVDVEVRTDKSTLAGRVDADRSKCPP
ncbi:MAG: molecular chaperone [Gemmatimonadota bacterium]